INIFFLSQNSAIDDDNSYISGSDEYEIQIGNNNRNEYNSLTQNGIIDHISESEDEDEDKLGSSNENEHNDLTKKGTKRKRNKHLTSVRERNQIKFQKKVEKHNLKPPCISCKKNCITLIPEILRLEINKQFWSVSKNEQRMYVINSVERRDVKRRRGHDEIRKKWSFYYTLTNLDGIKVYVCKLFYLATLGFSSKNDYFIQNICSNMTEKSAIVSPLNKITRTAWNKCDLEPIKEHINSFNPTVAHYRREHAPNRKYLPNEINATYMYSDFKEKNPAIKFSYDVYRRTLREMNISFTKLGHEECELCELFDQHDSTHTKQTLNEQYNICDICKKYTLHLEKYINARAKYESHAVQKKKGNTNLDKIY
ncbi:uncharacterized protein LOC111039985, partial [Myzus persicae]|uniref:uncharacterized protein LOC111039985 n=1 Tax=Myzus persicae TaxID=13164 RepID=UPI000B932498